MTDATNLEISLRTRGVDTFQIELRIDDPESEAERRVAGREPIRLDRAQLLKLEIDPAAYGVALGRILFAEQELRDTLNETLAVTQAQETPLHLRLSIGPTAIDLHNIRWETLRLRADEPLLMGENMRFSRHLSSLDWRPVHMRPKGDLRALIAIANPADVEAYSLARVDVPGELARIEAALAEMDRSVLASAASDDDSTPATDAVTLGNIAAHLRDGYDILYLVAHGKLVKGEPYLWLQNPDGTTNRIAGRELVERLRELDHRPTLVVLASCQSAGDGEQPTAHDDGALAALGPRLAQAGIPVVVAMQGNVSMETVAHFMPKFFTELGRDGQIDRAIAVARGAVRKRSDWWMPVLFTRLKRGRIWYTPGFGGEKKGLAEWPSLEIAVEYQKCTPILGPGLTEPLFGSLTEMAARWASSYGFPMDPHHREELPQVAQYLTVQQGEFFVLRELGEHVRAELWQRFGDVLDPELEHAKLDDLMTAVGASLRSDIAPSPYQILAGLDLPIYITTNLNNLLADALRAEGKDPK